MKRKSEKMLPSIVYWCNLNHFNLKFNGKSLNCLFDKSVISDFD